MLGSDHGVDQHCNFQEGSTRGRAGPEATGACIQFAFAMKFEDRSVVVRTVCVVGRRNQCHATRIGVTVAAADFLDSHM